MIRHWDHWLTDKVSHLLVQKITPHIEVLNDLTKSLIKDLKSFEIVHVRRNYNTVADSLANNGKLLDDIGLGFEVFY